MKRAMIKITNYFKADYVMIRERLGQVNWVLQLRGNFLTAYVNFLNVLETAMDGCACQSMKMLKIRKISI